MKKIFRKISEFFLEEKFCPYCKTYVKVETKITHKGRRKIELKKCIRCKNIIEEIIQAK